MIKKNRKLIIGGILIGFMAIFFTSKQMFAPKKSSSFVFQSIDTMKFSRDLAREKKNIPEFDTTINEQMVRIKTTGATHVAIATPYDEEFYSMLKRWVKLARDNKLKVWLRGNFSGWEGWFEYKKITREQHYQQTKSFLENHIDIFEDGDVFTPCPECENGGTGDPRSNGDVTGHRKFLIDEYHLTQDVFKKNNLDVKSNFASMNLDVAKLIMDKETTRQLDGLVTVDHYVKNPVQLSEDLSKIAELTGGQIVLGEFGAPIPDLTGDMTEDEQAKWVRNALKFLLENKHVIGVNYWVGEGGSTQLWDSSGKERKAVEPLRSVYKLTYN